MAELLAPFAGKRSPELAALLRTRFGTLSRALAAPSSELRKVSGRFSHACDLLIAARQLVESAQREKLQSEIVDPHNPDLLVYIRSRICGANEERLLIIFCDSFGRYLIDEEMGWSSPCQIRLDLSSLFDRAVYLDAPKILLAHNHPSEDCRPSGDDIQSTRYLAAAAQDYGIDVVDHVIMTHKKAYSMRAAGLF